MHDIRLAIRQLFLHPGFTLAALLTLALGIGANTAIFSVVHAVLLNPFPYPESQQIAFIGETRQGESGTMPVTYPDYLHWAKHAQSFEQLAWVNSHSAALTGIAEPALLRVAPATAGVWPLLGMSASLGRTFAPEHDRPAAAPVVVLSDATWRKQFAADPNILGRVIELDNRAYEVLGVMPASFKFWAADAWIPAGLESESDFMQSRVMRTGGFVVGRVKQDVAFATAQQELEVLSAQIAQQFPDTNKGVGANVQRLTESVVSNIRPSLLLLACAVGCLLMIACVNVANLVLARAVSREREFGVRVALGASRARLLRQVLLENLPISLLGGGLGVLLAHFGLVLILRLLPTDTIPAEAQISVNWPVLAFALALSIGSTLVFGIFAALGRATRVTSDTLREGGGGTGSSRTQRMRAVLVVSEVALAVILLVGAGLLLRSFDRLQRVELGFDTSQLLLMPLQLPEHRSPEQATQTYRDILLKLQALPGATAVAAALNVPLVSGFDMPLLREGEAYGDLNDLKSVQINLVMGDYFKAQGLQLKQGRTLAESDNAASMPVIVMNETAVRQFLPDQSALRARVMIGIPPNLIKPGMLPPGMDKFQWATVVGVVEDVRHFGVERDAPPSVYIPVDQGFKHLAARANMTLLIRTHSDPLALANAARAALWSIDPNLPVQRVASMEQVLAESFQGTRFNAVLFGTFAALALILSAIGIYGVVAWNVAQRAREIGIRMALGAKRGDVVQQVVREGMRVVGLGIALGFVGAIAVAWLMANIMSEVRATDPWPFALVLLLLTMVATLACWLPARRAAGNDPMMALRAP
jgi:putative ABC transport system permease protein